jgi:SAM-dependent methyltransferase
MRIYSALAEWYPLVDPREDHADEAAVYAAAIRGAAQPFARTLLELGAGAGNNAWYLKQDFACTLTDVSAAMQALSRAQNPECEHLSGDMRTMRLDRTFDAVLVHDAVVYMTSAEDLLRAVRTAYVHVRPGGVALFAPDYVRETFVERAALLSADAGRRSLRGVEWAWDPDPADHTYRADYALLLRDGEVLTSVHDSHVEGLFERSEWTAVLAEAGFAVEPVHHPLGPDEIGELFLGRRTA